ncbi:tautomerase-like protein [Chitinophaga niastensis]|uniref:Tautomerase-like protein n=1 Tax=Chitinophaga niastensis TaxID=536980 RepID=A0A2P8HNV1_CHINA|nr:tautomerase family protein [Chitinophaga niastensis]PSL47886.1 tautomerase-like protein [Chitinophaga niastensis]
MPFVQIYLADHLSKKNKKDISTAVHHSLVNIFNVPVDDYFQVIHAMPAEDIVSPDSYFNVPHTNNLLYIRITAKTGRTVEMKKQLYQSIAAKIAATTPVSEDDVIIVLVENELADWSFGRGIAQMA